MPPDPDRPPACQPDEEPLVDLDTFDRAGRAMGDRREIVSNSRRDRTELSLW